MADEKDRFGETMRLVERAKEDIYLPNATAHYWKVAQPVA